MFSLAIFTQRPGVPAICYVHAVQYASILKVHVWNFPHTTNRQPRRI